MKPVNRMLSDEAIKLIEQKYDAKYVMDSCLRQQDGSWANWPAAFFYTEEKHPEGSNYMAFYQNQFAHEGWLITNGIHVSEGEFDGFIFNDGTLVHSRFRHDYFEHRGAVVDGGRDYFRSASCPPEARGVKFRVVDGELVEVSDGHC